MVKEVPYSGLIEPRLNISTIGSPYATTRRNTGSMKKYYQAALLAVALLSLVSLLFYRHEYNRLRYVLEVLNFYGKPGAKDTEQQCLGENAILSKLDPLFNSPLPSWHRLNNDLFIYSAHRLKKSEIRAIGFSKLSENLNLNCKVYFEGKIPILGTFKYAKINENSEYAGYELICEYTGIAIPESVSFFDTKTHSEDEILVLNVKNSPDNLATNEIALCVAPPMNKSISRTDMISFLNFHQIIGVPNFIVYDYGIPSRFTETVKDIIVTQNLNITLTILPWNFPFFKIPDDMIKGLIETECLYRTYNEVEYSSTLHWEEYLVLKYHHNLLELLKEFEETITPSNVKRYFINTSVFCTQEKDDESTTNTAPITALRKTKKVSSGGSIKYTKIPNFYINKPHSNLNLDKADDDAKVDSDLINVNHYRYCDEPNNDITFVNDKSILKFADDMFDASIYKEYITRRALSQK